MHFGKWDRIPENISLPHPTSSPPRELGEWGRGNRAIGWQARHIRLKELFSTSSGSAFLDDNGKFRITLHPCLGSKKRSPISRLHAPLRAKRNARKCKLFTEYPTFTYKLDCLFCTASATIVLQSSNESYVVIYTIKSAIRQ